MMKTSAAVWYLRNPLAPSQTPCLLRLLGAQVGPEVRVKRSLIVDNAITDENSTGDFSHLEIGRNTYVGDQTYIDLADNISIQKNVTISGQSSFITHADCNRSPWLSDRFARKQSPVLIEEGSWIGFGATIMPDVTISKRSVVAAGAVVTEDTEEKSIYGGVPASKMSNIDDNSGQQL